MDIDPRPVDERFQGTLADLLGIRFVEATPTRGGRADRSATS